MSGALDAAVSLAATHRITKLVVEDEISRPIREFVEDRWPDSKVAYLVTCPACVSVWAGAAVVAMPKSLRWTLALSDGTMLIKWAAELIEASTTGD